MRALLSCLGIFESVVLHQFVYLESSNTISVATYLLSHGNTYYFSGSQNLFFRKHIEKSCWVSSLVPILVPPPRCYDRIAENWLAYKEKKFIS